VFDFAVPGAEMPFYVPEKQYVVQVAEYKPLTPPKSATVYFDFDSAKLRVDQVPKLRIFKRGDKVIVKGYASPEGPEHYNYRLSLRRAYSVKKFLERKGVKVEKVRAFGESMCFEPPRFWWKCRKVEVEER